MQAATRDVQPTTKTTKEVKDVPEQGGGTACLEDELALVDKQAAL